VKTNKIGCDIMTKSNNPVIKKNNKWYNKLTKRYVSEAYAKRINNYFKKNPDGTLLQATGHGKYDVKTPLYRHSKKMNKMLRGTGTQLIKTVNKKGKTVYFSPVHKQTLDLRDMKKLKKLDYKICSKNAFVELYRLTRDRNSIYHIITWKPNLSFGDPFQINLVYPELFAMYSCIEREAKKLRKHYPIGRSDFIYFHVTTWFYSKNGGGEKGKTSKVYFVNKKGFDLLKDDFKELFVWYKQKLENDTYTSIHLLSFTLYINNFVHDSFEKSNLIAKYRIGVNKTSKNI
jgi:hypothetical protein